MDFGVYAGMESRAPVIPGGSLAWVWINVKEVSISPTKGTRYLECELTVDNGQGGPNTGRKIFTNIMDPMHADNSEAAKQMGQIAICRILECNGASPQNPAGYQIQKVEDIHGKRAAIKIKVVPPENGYSEKNDVGEWLTPNPASKSGNKPFLDLVAGKYTPEGGVPASAASQMSMFASPAQPAQTTAVATAPAAQPAWTAPAANPPLAAAQAPAPAAAPAWSAPAQASSTVQGQTPAQTQSPSEAPKPNWLAQAQQQR